MPWLEIRQVQCLMAVARFGSLGRAAASLEVSAPSLSETIARLERQVGTPLFHRLPQGLALTSAGKELLPKARRVLQDVETVRATVAHAAGNVSGRVVLGVSPGATSGTVVGLIAQLRSSYPGLAVRVVEVPEDEVLEGVFAGRFDLAFTSLPRPGSQDVAAVRASLVFHEHEAHEVVLVLPPSVGADLPDRVSLDAVPDLPMVLSNATSLHQAEVLTRWEQSRGTAATVAVNTDHWNAALPLVLSGVGMTWAREPETLEAKAIGCTVCRLDPPILIRHYVVHRQGVLAPAARFMLRNALAAPVNANAGAIR